MYKHNESVSSRKSNRQSHSPSIGRLHKQRQSFGPTVCLISKNSTQNNQQDTNRQKMMILMLGLEIQRLNKLVEFKSNVQTNQSTQTLKNQINYFKEALNKSQQERILSIEKQNRLIFTQTNTISDYQGQISVYIRRLKQQEEENQYLKKKNHQLEKQVNQSQLEASRTHVNLQEELQKSMIRERSKEVQVWNQKLVKYQEIINDQKIFINELKFTIDKKKNNQLEAKQRYDYDLSNLHSKNSELLKKNNHLQSEIREIATQNISKTNSKVQQIEKREAQINKLMIQIDSLKRQVIEQKSKNKKLEKEYDERENSLKMVIEELKKKIKELDNSELKQNNKNAKNLIIRLKMENNGLMNELSSTKKQLRFEINSLNQELEQKNQKLRKITKKNKRVESQIKLNKSYSTHAFGRESSHWKDSSRELDGIIDEVKELQDSNFRVSKLILSKNKITASSVSGSIYLNNNNTHFSSYGI